MELGCKDENDVVKTLKGQGVWGQKAKRCKAQGAKNTHTKHERQEVQGFVE